MKCLLDLDGTIANFVQAMCISHDRTDPFEEGHTDYYLERAWDMTLEEFWEPSNNAEWWANIPKYDNSDRIVEMVEDYLGFDNICILTTPTVHPQSLAGKVMWIQKNYPQYERKFLIGPQKQFCAHPNSVLIDDHNSNIVSFVTEGGNGILVPRPWNPASGEDVLDYLETQLESLIDESNRIDVRRPTTDSGGVSVRRRGVPVRS